MLFGNYNNLNMLQMSNYETANPYFCNGSVTGSLFSGTNSIFNFNPLASMTGSGYGFMTNCNGEPNWNAMLGFGLGNLALNFVGAFTAHCISTKQEDSTQSIDADIQDLNKKIDVELGKLGDDVNESNYREYDVKTESWYTDKKAEIDKNLLSESDLTSYKNTVKEYDDLVKEKGQTATTTERKTEIETLLTAKKSAYDAAKEKIEAHEQALEDQKALDDRVETEQAKADKIIEKITDLIDKRNNAEEALDKAILDAADGNSAQRRSQEKFEARFKFDENNNIIDGKDKVTKKDVRYAILAYRNAKDDVEKQKWATRFQNLYNELNEEDKNDPSLAGAYSIICG